MTDAKREFKEALQRLLRVSRPVLEAEEQKWQAEQKARRDPGTS